MSDEKDKKNVKGIGKTQKTTSVSKVDNIEEVKKVGKTTGVKRSGKTPQAGDNLQRLRYEDREKLLGMVDEEAKNLFRSSKLPEEQKRLIREAVKMAIDSALVEEDDTKKTKEDEKN